MAELKTVVNRQIRTLFDVGALGAMPDRGLLEQFGRGGAASESAFATLVERHGPMVLRVSRHLLADEQLAEDAFQVTFLLLARRAPSIHDPDALAGWLHRVARRVALRARAGVYRSKDRERLRAGELAVTAEDSLEREEIGAIVHEEIDRLVESQRLPILLCGLEGLSHEEAAQRLRWPVGTVKSRLVRGRRRLEGRLARRGLAPALWLVVGLFGAPARAATVPLALAVATTRAGLRSAVGTAMAASVPASIATLLQRELTAMLLFNIKLAAGAAFAGGFAVAMAVLVVLNLDRPIGQPAVGIDPASRQTLAPVAKPPVVPTTNLANVSKAARGIQETQPVSRGGEKVKRIAEVPERRLTAFGEQVLRSIHDGAAFLKSQQQVDGSWADIEQDAKTGVTSLVTLALLASGEKADSASIRKATDYLRGFRPDVLRSTYAVSLQTMVFAAVDPVRDRSRIEENVGWLDRAQIKPGNPQPWSGSWSYSNSNRGRPGDNSNTQYALLGLYAASEVGIPVNPSVWELSRNYWEKSQNRDGSWAYTPDSRNPTASMTCAGVASLIMSGHRQFKSQEVFKGETIENCGNGEVNRHIQTGIDWLTSHFSISQNFGAGPQWIFYYLYGLERAGRLTGMRTFGEHDWYRLGALELVREQNKLSGCFEGKLVESNQVLATSFALLFLATGRAPVLMNKLRHGPGDDWNNDPDDVRNIVNVVSKDWKALLTWQVVDSKTAAVTDLLRAPILFINGHKPPEFTDLEKQVLREYVERGGFIFAEACCGSGDFDRGFRTLVAEMFPNQDDQLRPLAEDHAIWRAKHRLTPGIYPLWGIRRGARTAVIYSPKDLSCFWNHSERDPKEREPAVMLATQVGENLIEYVTGRRVPPDKLEVPSVHSFQSAPQKRGALHVARLRHAGHWNVAPQAIPNVMHALRNLPYQFDVDFTQKDLFPRDPNLIYYPLLYIQGRGSFSFAKEDLAALRQHLGPGGGTLFADAACGDPEFDAAFRRLVAGLLPNNPLVPIPSDDELFTKEAGVDLSNVQYTKAAGFGRGFPQLEGVRVKDHWAVIYSKFDIGCALENYNGIECKGYTYESAVQILGNIVIYSTLP
jgi:RNA polymerase sigma factor (sigma-70 family)